VLGEPCPEDANRPWFDRAHHRLRHAQDERLAYRRAQAERIMYPDHPEEPVCRRLEGCHPLYTEPLRVFPLQLTMLKTLCYLDQFIGLWASLILTAG
jgi:hypothetical protein